MPAPVAQLFQEHLDTVQALRDQIPAIERLGALLAQRLKEGRRIMLCGNGGSAADSQHIAAEFVCRFETERHPLPAIALTTDTSALTAIGNDYGFERVFARQLQALGQTGDVLIGISTSGNSPNVLEAVRKAKEIGVTSIGLLGGSGGPIGAEVDHALIVPSKVTARIQECHILIGHIWCGMTDAAFA
jgi:D-sedoheptulose 7-phosphate isomerase